MATAFDLEERLSRELHLIADELRVPPRPPIAEEARTGHRWYPLLVAAAVLVIVAAGIALVAGTHRSAPPVSPTHTPAPSPTPSRAAVHIPRTAPTIPYVLHKELHVGGATVAGKWTYVEHAGRTWIAERSDHTWWYGSDTTPTRIAVGEVVGRPVLATGNGTFAAMIVRSGNGTRLTGFETSSAGEGLGVVKVPAHGSDGAAVTVAAVTDQGNVFVSGGGVSLMWEPMQSGRPLIDLAKTAPGQVVVSDSPIGTVLTDGPDGAAYTADIRDDGSVQRRASLPSADVVVDPSGARLVWPHFVSEPTWGDQLRVRPSAGGATERLTLPVGWGFNLGTWSWETPDLLVSRVMTADGLTRMARCSVAAGHCVLLG